MTPTHWSGRAWIDVRANWSGISNVVRAGGPARRCKLRAALPSRHAARTARWHYEALNTARQRIGPPQVGVRATVLTRCADGMLPQAAGTGSFLALAFGAGAAASGAVASAVGSAGGSGSAGFDRLAALNVCER